MIDYSLEDNNLIAVNFKPEAIDEIRNAIYSYGANEVFSHLKRVGFSASYINVIIRKALGVRKDKNAEENRI